MAIQITVIKPEEFAAVKNALNFRGKVVLLTGSSSGIGAAAARLFTYLGAQVVVTGRNQSRINEVVEDCKKLSPDKKSPFGIRLDLTIPGNIARLVNETIKVYKKIDVLVNNAGIGSFATIQDLNFNKIYRELQAINEQAHVEITRLAVPYLEKTNGSIIFIASILGRNPVLSTGGYSMGKNAIVAFAQALCQDLGPKIRVNVISPGIVDGTRIFRLFDPNSPRPLLIERSIASSSLRRPGVPLDIAKLIVFLATEDLSGHLNGQQLFADGGAYIPLL